MPSYLLLSNKSWRMPQFQFLLIAYFLLCLLNPLLAQNWEEQQKLIPSEDFAGNFGEFMSVYENYALVGAIGDSELGSSTGAAYIYERQANGKWLEMQKLLPHTAGIGDILFGISVSIYENTALVGAPFYQGERKGVYVFKRNNDGLWVQHDILKPDEEVSSFGTSVSLYGNLALIGDSGAKNNETTSGAAYIFEEQNDGSWKQIDRLVSHDIAEQDAFGFSVSLQENQAIIGARSDDDKGDNSGSVYVFEKQPDDSWVETNKLTAQDGSATDLFGEAVEIEGKFILVGAPSKHGVDAEYEGAAYLFEIQEDGSWVEKQKLTPDDIEQGDNIGKFISINGDLVLLGAPNKNIFGERSGAAYIFEKQENGEWIEQEQLIPTDGEEGAQFGCGVELFDGGALIGACNDDPNGENKGTVYFFEEKSSTEDDCILLYPDTTLTATAVGYGWAVDLQGNQALIGASNVRKAFLFEENDGNWTQSRVLRGSDVPRPEFGGSNYARAVAIDGELAAVSDAASSGAVYIFEKQANGDWLEVEKLTAPDAPKGESFGYAIALQQERILIGAPEAWGPSGSGTAYMFERQDDGSWEFQTKLNSDAIVFNDWFGVAVALDGNRALIGAHHHETYGAAFIFEEQSDGSWIEVDKIAPTEADLARTFGLAVSLDGDIAVVGAPFSSPGKAFIFERQTDGNWEKTAYISNANYHHLGWSVSSEDNFALIGTGFNGIPEDALLYEKDGNGTWNLVANICSKGSEGFTGFGYSLSLNESRALIGAPWARIGGAGIFSGGTAYLCNIRPFQPCTVFNTNDDGPGSLRDFIKNKEDCNTIYFDACLSGRTIKLKSPIVIDRDLVIMGLGADKLAISGNQQNRIFEIAEGVSVGIHRITLTEGKAETEGGGILNQGELSLHRVNMHKHEAVPVEGSLLYTGGAIMNKGVLHIDSCLFSDNTARTAGAISNFAGTSLDIQYSVFTGNKALLFGGGALNNATRANATVLNTIFDKNEGKEGAAIRNQGHLDITESKFRNNVAMDGGAIHNSRSGGQITLENCELTDNTASNIGGAIYNSSGTIDILTSTFEGNIAIGTGDGFGGALLNDLGGTMTLAQSTLRANRSSAKGAGIYNLGNASIINSTIGENYIENEGSIMGVGIYTDGELKLYFSTIAYNKSVSRVVNQGIGIFNATNGILELSSNIFAHNTSQSGPDPTLAPIEDGFNQGTLNDLGFNLVSNNDNFNLESGNGNILDADPELLPWLSEDGHTPVYPISETSLAVDHGSPNSSPEVDQLGLPRSPRNGSPDIGAFEYQYPVGIQSSVKTQDLIKVYPNPTRDQIILSLNLQIEKGTQFVLVNMMGQSLLRNQINQTKQEIHIGHLPRGLYNLLVFSPVGEIMGYVKVQKH